VVSITNAKSITDGCYAAVLQLRKTKKLFFNFNLFCHKLSGILQWKQEEKVRTFFSMVKKRLKKFFFFDRCFLSLVFLAAYTFYRI
jgi:hypothetical protein